jgi:hypothetical protein
MTDDAPAVTDTDGWDTPLPLGWQTDLPPFPEILPGVLGTYAAALAEATQTPLDLAGSVVLGVVAGCIGGRVRVCARPGWTEPTNLWTVPVLASGSRKSAVMDAAASPLLDAEQILCEGIADTRLDRTVERDARQKHAAKMIADAGRKCDPAALARAQQAAREADEIVVPAWPQLTVDDCTPEALVSVMAEQGVGGRIVAISAEAGLFEALGGASYNKRSKIETILKAHAGDTIRVNRQMREPQLVRRPALTLICTIQPYALRQLVGNSEYAGRGLLQRTLWSLPPDNVGYRKVGAAPVPEELAQQYSQLIRRLATEMGSTTQTTVIKLHPHATEAHLTYESRVEVLLRPDGGLGVSDLMRRWGSKLAGATLRIAGVLHAAAMTELGGEVGAEISVDTIRSAVELAEYYRVHAAAALHPADNQAAADCRALLGWLTGRSADSFGVRDVRRGAPRRFRESAELTRRAIDTLAELGWCRLASAGSGWELHPDAETHLRACDTCDTPEETPAQAAETPLVRLSHPDATGGDAVRHSPGTVAPRRTRVRQPTTATSHAPASGNEGGVAPVAPVAGETCRVCSEELDPLLAARWHRDRIHPRCHIAEDPA